MRRCAGSSQGPCGAQLSHCSEGAKVGEPRIQFSLRRMLLSTTLFAVGLAFWFLPDYVDMTYWPGDELPNLLVATLGMALMVGSVGAMCTRTLKGLYIGLGVGAFIILAFYVYVVSQLSE